jgi:hypothetical protein
MTHDLLVRGVAAIGLSLLACGAAAPAEQLPFDQEILLDARRCGRKRMPILC